jgi:putative endonuclease
MANSRRTVLYTGVTADLRLRVAQHKAKADPQSFTSRYNTTMLVFFETTANIAAAIAREKQIKAGSRQDKLDLIARQNPEFRDIAGEWD